MMKISRFIRLSLVAAALGGFSAALAAPPPNPATVAVADPARPEADRASDAARKPAEILTFFGFAPGNKILDLFSGGGYYTEILSHLVGDKGHVIAHNNQAYLGFKGDDIRKRQAGNRLANVTWILSEANDLKLEPNSLDGVMMSQTYHDFYVMGEKDWPRINTARLLKEIYTGLKPGGVLAVIDHRALAGSGYDACNKLHRIDPEIVKREITAAGFILEGSSDILANPDDDHTKIVFDPAIRGKTDQFVLRFRKPA
jgi:predicted methyltransferase